MKIFVGIQDTNGYTTLVQKGLTELGHRCDGINITSENDPSRSLSYPGVLPRFLRYNHTAYRKWHRKFRPISVFFNMIETLGLAMLFLRCLARYDIFIFTFDRSFLPYQLDLPLLKWLKKTIIFTVHGSDARPPYTEGSHSGAPCTIRALHTRTHIRFNRVRRIERYSDYILSSPFGAQFLRKPFINWYEIGIPHEPTTYPTRTMKAPSDKLTILHTPCKDTDKGSGRIQSAVDTLRDNGHRIHYIDVTGPPRETLLALIQKADIVIDRLYSDCFWSTSTVDTAMMGKPTLVCGNQSTDDITPYLPKDLPHDGYVAESQFESTLERWVTDPKERHRHGVQEQAFCREQWSYISVAKRLETILDIGPKPEWMISPNSVRYIYGMDCPKDRIRQMTQGLLDTYGDTALYLDDKPRLKLRLLNWI